MSVIMQNIFTIGHSTHSQEHLIALLRRHGISAVCDVRSAPYSRVNPQFNREEINQALRTFGIRYVFLGRELGGRSEDPKCYERGKVSYERLAQTGSFKRGLERLQEGAKSYRLALMCAEKEPLECHRAILVARHLLPLGLAVHHIHADGRLESHLDALRRLATILNLPEHDMFHSREELIYRRQEERIAFSSEPATLKRPSMARGAGS
jgi:uncharacterized protein (DUF488 family)